MKTALLALGGVLALSCAREPDVVDLSALRPEPGSGVALHPLALAGAASFDRLDEAVPDPADRLRLYNDLARLAPDSRPVLYRGALAALDARSDKGAAVAEGVWKKLGAAADDPDLAYLGLRVEHARLLGPDGVPRVDAGSVEAARRLVERAAAFAAAHAGWTGPRRVSAADVERLGREAADAVARFERGEKPPAQPDDTEPDDDEPEE